MDDCTQGVRACGWSKTDGSARQPACNGRNCRGAYSKAIYLYCMPAAGAGAGPPVLVLRPTSGAGVGASVCTPLGTGAAASSISPCRFIDLALSDLPFSDLPLPGSRRPSWLGRPGASTASAGTAPAGNHRFWRLSALLAHTKAPYKTASRWKMLRLLTRPGRARTRRHPFRGQRGADRAGGRLLGEGGRYGRWRRA